jgi:hypothetical protein
MTAEIKTSQEAWTCGFINHLLTKGYNVKEASAIAENSIRQIKTANARRQVLKENIRSILKG